MLEDSAEKRLWARLESATKIVEAAWRGSKRTDPEEFGSYLEAAPNAIVVWYLSTCIAQAFEKEVVRESKGTTYIMKLHYE